MLSDIEIAQQAKLRPIAQIAREMGLNEDEVINYGPYMAKVSLDVVKRLQDKPNGKYVDVTAITPTPLGEGKTVTTVGLGQALTRLGAKTMTCIRQPSLGPVFGIKGGAAGGGYSQVVPMENLNLHLTGDFHAVSAAHNLGAAALDNYVFQGSERKISYENLHWTRAVDMNDRSLRHATVGQGGEKNGVPHSSEWVITSASEIMSVLCLGEGLQEVRSSMGKMVMATDDDGLPVTAEDIQVAGAMTCLLKDAVMPTLMQNLEGAPVLVHAGPFANIAPGNSSITADRIGLKLADYTVTESGFGADMGYEKFLNIKCRKSGLRPDCVVIVATVRALKNHSGRFEVKAGRPLPPEIVEENLEALEAGLSNLVRHIENVTKTGAPAVVAINAFPTDSPREHELIREVALKAGAFDAVVHTMHAQGAQGGEDLARAVVRACEEPSQVSLTYTDDMSISQKIEAVATTFYRADGIDLSETALQSLERIERWGYGHLPICIAKTQYSISDNAKLKGAPDGWRLQVRDIKLSAGAGFVYVLCGSIMTMPGLSKKPAAYGIDIDGSGNITGLF